MKSAINVCGSSVTGQGQHRPSGQCHRDHRGAPAAPQPRQHHPKGPGNCPHWAMEEPAQSHLARRATSTPVNCGGNV